ncbi:MAG: alpha/beta hydrolase [Cyanobacteria bacterium P01_F01_bin.86]
MELQNPDGSTTYYITIGGDTDSPPASQHKPEPLLLLHGLGADHAMWRSQMQTYPTAGFHLLIPDLFGHGRSSKLRHIALSDWHRQINWLLDHHTVEQCTLMGVSMGGVIAQSFVVEYPHRVKRLIIADSFGELRTCQEKLLGFSQVIGFRLFQLFGKKLLVKAMESTYQTSYARVAQDYFRQVSLKVDLNQLILARRAINHIDVLTKLQDIALPALIMVGEDFGPSFITINQKIATALPQAKFVILERSRDPSNLVNSTAFDAQVLSFLKQPD